MLHFPKFFDNDVAAVQWCLLLEISLAKNEECLLKPLGYFPLVMFVSRNKHNIVALTTQAYACSV